MKHKATLESRRSQEDQKKLYHGYRRAHAEQVLARIKAAQQNLNADID